MSVFPSRREQRSHPLTRDNTLLSRTKNMGAKGAKPVDPEVERYIHDSVSENTKRAYRFDLKHFKDWGGSLPSSSEEVARYLANSAEVLAPATLARRLATLSKVHSANGWNNPCREDLVRSTLQGIKRAKGTKQKQAKPLLRDDLFLLLDSIGQTNKCKRDRALLLLGWAGGMRASELVGLNLTDVESVPDGLVLNLRRSKTDQEGRGRKIGIPFGRTRHCPVSACNEWISVLPLATKPLFRPINRHGTISSKRLRPDAVSIVLCNQLHEAGLAQAGFSGHSLRAGLVTSAVKLGVSTHKIRQQTGHASDVMLSRYVREAGLFEHNAISTLL